MADVYCKNLGHQITQDLFALGKSISKLNLVNSLAEVVLLHGRALELIYTKQGDYYCMIFGKFAASI